MNDVLQYGNRADHVDLFLFFTCELLLRCSSSCASLHKMADEGILPVEQRIKIVLFFAETRSVVVTQRRFHARFQTRWAPSFKTTRRLYNQFNNDGSVLERRRHRPSSVRSPENTDALRVALQWSPSKSTRKAAAQLGKSRRLVKRILKSDLNLYP
jgi:hypothetical protein